jgi:hypothetical protein
MLLKTQGRKMSADRLLAMLMKANELKSLSGDVDEKKGESQSNRAIGSSGHLQFVIGDG